MITVSSFSIASHAILVSADWLGWLRWEGHVDWDGFLALGHPRGPCISGSATHRLCLRSRRTRFLCPSRVSPGHPTRILSLSLVMSKHTFQTAVEIHNKCLQKLLVAESDQARHECIFCDYHQSPEHINETGNCRLPVFGKVKFYFCMVGEWTGELRRRTSPGEDSLGLLRLHPTK